ncbi:MAG: GNAT family N-acetyltransferase [Clostridiales bacterium]|nr:GNAT family N-acetyltransferase [Clostridiales bacterium]
MIKGKIIDLVPATLDDRQKVYDWCFCSETTLSHSGPPDYPDVPIPTAEEFFADYAPYFFTGAAPQDGQGFMIVHKGEPVGFISHCSFHLKPRKAELDIWLSSEANCGKGYGSDAIAALAGHLEKSLGMEECLMRPSHKNERAIRSYKKAGFEESLAPPDDYLKDEYLSVYGAGDYGADATALLIRRHPCLNH